MTTTTTTQATATRDPLSARRRQSMLATGVGNVLEWFDWAVYSVFSTYISAALFSKEDPVSAMLGTFAVFAVGFVMRPLGGLIFGRIADKKGRKFVLFTTMLMMAGGSFLIAIIPSFESIGAAASFLLLAARLIQGFAHGGEATATNVYLPEIAPVNRRALYSSAVAIAMGTGTLIATLLGTSLTKVFDADFMAHWGWRIPFLFGGCLALVVLWMRRNMMESDVHEAQTHAEAHGSTEVVADPGWSASKVFFKGLQVFFYQAGTTLPYYVWSSYIAVYAIHNHGMDKSAAFMATTGATLIYICLIPLVALAADTIGRKPPVLVYLVGTIALSIPLMNFISDNPWTLFIAQSIMMGLSAAVGATQPAMLSEQVPTRYRTLILGTAMPAAVAIFGGTAPYLNQYLVSKDWGAAFNYYVIAVCAISTLVVVMWRETRGIDLHNIR